MSCRNAVRVDGLFGLLPANNRRLGLDPKFCLDLGLSSTWIRPSAPFPIIHEVGLGVKYRAFVVHRNKRGGSR